ncbi:uncharacterized protein LOC110862762 isoform X1 [Folsomia candida]|uniref:uncharacterized protein LOC110862762 isoform X1 n=1 Tax=Folsomia candida TaxID=158441 RepID=UPI000B905DC4|nr:uncharacterized protein LOC110862762 isoform X1 [Folsomia candida]
MSSDPISTQPCSQQPLQLLNRICEPPYLHRLLGQLGSFYIKRSGHATSYACGEDKQKIFSYSEKVHINRVHALSATMMFTNNDGIEFITMTYDFAVNTKIVYFIFIRGINYQLQGGKIRTVDAHLGVLNPAGCCEAGPFITTGAGCGCCGRQTFVAIPTRGGIVTMKPRKVGCRGCCLFACCCSGSPSYDILVNGDKVGSLSRDGGDDALRVTFPPSETSELKGIIVVLSFTVFNLYW